MSFSQLFFKNKHHPSDLDMIPQIYFRTKGSSAIALYVACITSDDIKLPSMSNLVLFADGLDLERS